MHVLGKAPSFAVLTSQNPMSQEKAAGLDTVKPGRCWQNFWCWTECCGGTAEGPQMPQVWCCLRASSTAPTGSRACQSNLQNKPKLLAKLANLCLTESHTKKHLLLQLYSNSNDISIFSVIWYKMLKKSWIGVVRVSCVLLFCKTTSIWT